MASVMPAVYIDVLLSTAHCTKESSSTISSVVDSPVNVCQIKLLGATPVANLNFNAQSKNVFKASYLHIRALRRIRSSLSRRRDKLRRVVFNSA